MPALRFGSSAAMRAASRGIQAFARRRDPFTLPDAALARFYFAACCINQQEPPFAHNEKPDQNRPLPAHANEYPSQQEGFFFMRRRNACETRVARLKRNCEHYSACIDKQIMFLYLQEKNS